METSDNAMTIKEVAKFLTISNQMVYNMVNNGSLPAFKIGSASRIMYSDVLQFIKTSKDEFNSVLFQDEIGDQDEKFFVIQNLNMDIGTFQLKNINFKLPLGKIMTLIGPSGSGKTMLLRSMAGLENINSGSIFIGPHQIDNLSTSDRKIGFVFERYGLFPNMNARKNIEFPLNIRKQKEQVINQETANRLSELNIEKEYLKYLPRELPEGMKQLVAIAREKNHTTELLLLDEPMSQLDAYHHDQMRIFIQKIIRDLGKTTIMTFHGPEDALVLSDYIGVMNKGRLIQFGETWEVYHNPGNAVIMEMLTRYGLNQLEINIRNGITEPFKIRAGKEDGEYMMAFRPEEVKVTVDGIPAEIKSFQLLDGKRKLSVCSLEDGMEVRLLIPLETENKFNFTPIRPCFFKCPEYSGKSGG
ncbi:MAG: ATP-binding cassette domain-containing protein [Spirochaetales bacterium]|nr:ATP-binding cassette domain-containing protein [Spirochaetales bacterium]